ncbi:protein cornichon homolog 1-like [Phoenix dactylifera]|uniref:Protein cornichon homolog 1-like n=1 Tax=Phoenix dactylifera TaxID=42345 RepID=A0A8B8ZDA9_PHODC|nr:protein cornichon homolog 1-like [Phoenix dactylifera]XP_026660970.1 protein cornichon homolog 1-like [Phoenix dactylifera]XP_026660971.1 protein cornichon homolog 1-like [Phoenix dactylifera]XP_038972094.1 protein cornichon homolog 1-like [Phoenix dactylifera]XP_038972095.1 protein cornichon homolog 1-like [Phoenix dactylifera]XP_038972096.1 protein cornichon homolog 1-like [Phoenix dactylifera]
MAWELLLWLYAFASVISLIALTAYQLINLSDLEFDYINPYDLSSRINAVVIPEFLVQGILCASFLLTWHWFPFLIMAPITCYHINLFMNRRHLIDVTEIFRLLHGEKKYRIIKLSIYFSIFVIVIYRLVMSAVLLLMDEGDGSLETFLS